MPDIIVWLTAVTLGLGLLAGGVKAIVWLVRLLTVIEGHTKQLTPNAGSHVADAVRRTEKKIDSIAEEQSTVRAELETHREQTAEKFSAVWEQIATRDINKAAIDLHAAADRAEAAAPPRIEN